MKHLLWPFAFIYFILTEFRLVLYRLGFFKTKKIPVPVISIGNLSFGGTGKSPLAIALYKQLSQDFSHIVILSRGYKRKSKGPVIVSEKGQILVDVLESGDEAMMIAEQCPHATIVVSEDRMRGYECIKNQNPNLIILDDAFQHIRIHRDINLLVTSGYDPFWKDHIFPVGRLREARKNFRRADILCITKFQYSFERIEPAFQIMYTNYRFNQPLNPDIEYELISGIVDLKPIQSYLSQEKIKLKAVHHLSDHADLSEFEIHMNNEDHYIMTAKDFVKFHENHRYKIHVLHAEFELPSGLVKSIKSKISVI